MSKALRSDLEFASMKGVECAYCSSAFYPGCIYIGCYCIVEWSFILAIAEFMRLASVSRFIALL